MIVNDHTVVKSCIQLPEVEPAKVKSIHSMQERVLRGTQARVGMAIATQVAQERRLATKHGLFWQHLATKNGFA